MVFGQGYSVIGISPTVVNPEIDALGFSHFILLIFQIELCSLVLCLELGIQLDYLALQRLCLISALLFK